MRRYTLYDRLMVTATALCLCLPFTSCSEDGGGSLPEGPELCTVTITLQTSRQAQLTKTKADGDIPTDPWEGWENDEKYERDITDWLVVAYGTDGTLAGYTSSEGTYNQVDDDSRTSVEWELPVGTYNFYAFANLKSLEEGEALYKSITNPTTSTENALKRGVQLLKLGSSIDGRNETPGKFGGAEDSRQRIPMSSYAQMHTLVSHAKGQPTPDANQFAIPLIRMIGKVQVEITNMLDQALTVNQLDIINLRKGSLPIWLLPWEISGSDKFLEFNGKKENENDVVAHVAPNFPQTTGVTDEREETVAESHLFQEEIKPKDNEKTIPRKPANSSTGTKQQYSRYIPETSAPIGNDGGGIQLGVDIKGRTYTKHLTGFDFVRRNDLLVIPVLITNITTTIEVAEQRLPIGVYPTSIQYGAGSGIQVLAPFDYTLQAAGDLSIRFQISKIDGVNGEFKIKGYKVGEDGGVTVGEKFSSLLWLNNNEELITSVSIGDKDHTKDKEIKIPESVLTDNSGSFTVHTQEIGHKAFATLTLTLVVNYGDNMEQEMQIPYTIIIRNYKQNETQP